MSAGSGPLVSHAPRPSALSVVIRKRPCFRTALPRAKEEQTWSFTPTTYKGRWAQTPANNSRKCLETSASDNCRHQDAHCSIPEKPQRRRKPLWFPHNDRIDASQDWTIGRSRCSRGQPRARSLSPAGQQSRPGPRLCLQPSPPH